jgi:Arc/MetJ-type ribon-helix-helix transcriptional regulator
LREHGEYLNAEASTLIRTMTFKVTAWIEEAVERLVREGLYRSKSQFLRKAVLKLLEEHGVRP